MGTAIYGSTHFISCCCFSTAILRNIRIFSVFVIIQNTIYKLYTRVLNLRKKKIKNLSSSSYILYLYSFFYFMYRVSSTIIYLKNIIHPRKLAKLKRDKIGFKSMKDCRKTLVEMKFSV